MAAPTYSAGTPGNVFSATLAANKNIAAVVDLSTILGGAVHCKMTTGGSAPTQATTFSFFRAYGATVAAPNTTLSAAPSPGATSLSVGSATGISSGQKIAVVTASGLVGEIVTVSSISGTTLTLGAGTENAYAIGDFIFLIEQVASGGVLAPGSSWAASTTYSSSIYPPAAWIWIVQAANADSAQTVTVSATVDKNPSFL